MKRRRARSDDDKLAQLILYLARKCEADPDFGSTKLNRLLFFSDFYAYGKWGRSITDQVYQRLASGPGPRRLATVRRELIRSRKLAIRKITVLGNVQDHPVALAEPDLTRFTGEEIALVDEVLDRTRDMTGKRAGELAHRFMGWGLAAVNETIPYHTVFLSDQPLSREEIAALPTFTPTLPDAWK